MASMPHRYLLVLITLVVGCCLPASADDYAPEIVTSPSCRTVSTRAVDTVFREIPYCHLQNPTERDQFLKKGYDVPASFLASFTSVEIERAWSQMPVQPSGAVQLPMQLVKQVNLMASDAWEQILKCSGGDLDQARESYRTSKYQCPEAAEISRKLSEIVQSLHTLAETVDTDKIYKQNENANDGLPADLSTVDCRGYEIDRRGNVQVNMGELMNYIMAHPETRGDDSTKLRMNACIARKIGRDKYHELNAPRKSVDQMRLDNAEEIRVLIPKTPITHPLLIQIMLEEMLAHFSTNQREMKYLGGLLTWMEMIEDRDCSSLGLWPSANRAAAQTMSMKAAAMFNAAYGRRATMRQTGTSVTCAFPGSRAAQSNLPRIYFDQREDLMKQIARLHR